MTSFRYPEVAAHGGRLEYHGPIPVLVVEGDPAAIGRQVGELALKPAARLLDYPLDFIRSQVRLPLLPGILFWLLKRKCRSLYRNVPVAYRGEIEAIIATCPDRGRLIPANTLFDMSQMGIRPLFGCSSFVVSPRRSVTGRLLFGRNLDFYSLGYLNDFSLVTVYRPAPGRLGFMSLGFPGLAGCFSGMNSAGLCLARHEVLSPKVRRTFNSAGIPFAMALREVLETCSTVADARLRLNGMRHATVNLVVLADVENSCVLELTPDGIFEQETKDDVIGCSNHFLHPALVNPNQVNAFHTVDRLDCLRRVAIESPLKLDLETIWSVLGRVHQGDLTIQTMVFEPAISTTHVSFGTSPTTNGTSTPVVLSKFLN